MNKKLFVVGALALSVALGGVTASAASQDKKVPATKLMTTATYSPDIFEMKAMKLMPATSTESSNKESIPATKLVPIK